MLRLKKDGFVFLMILLLVFSGRVFFAYGDSGIITISVKIAVCGNNTIEGDQVCDGTDLASKTCQDFGYDRGTLGCSPACDIFDFSGCYYNDPVTLPRGGGGAPALDTKVIFTGRAYPDSDITVLKDAQVAATTKAGADARFEISLSGLSGGNYVFSLYAEDYKGFRSSPLTFPVGITSGATTHVSGIFMAPTLGTDKTEVKRGDSIAFFGQSTAEAEITIMVSSEEELFLDVKADEEGIYLYNFDSTLVSPGKHYARSKASLKEEISSFSEAVEFLVSTRTVLKEPEILRGDLNNAGRVNLIDFSIAVYWYRRPLTPRMLEIEKERLNGDGVIDLVDFSIMAYYWTG